MSGDESNDNMLQPLRLMSHTPLVKATYRERFGDRTFDITVEKHLNPDRYYWNVDELDQAGLPNHLWDSGPTGYADAVAAYLAAKWMIRFETGGSE
jgi:hypothetical protein